jgi:hypothetical protein
MTRVKKLRSQGTVSSHGEVARLLKEPGDYAIVERGVARSFVMICPDGCGETLTVNLDPRSGKAWRLDRRNDKTTLYPSVWRKQGCKSHFIVWRDTVRWCDWAEEGVVPARQDLEAIQRALAAREGEFVHYEVLAEECSMNPWDAAWAGHALKGQGKIMIKDHSYFAVPRRSADSTIAPIAPRKRRWWWPW